LTSDAKAFNIKARTTLDIDAPILKQLKDLKIREGRSMGQIVSQLLTEALARRKKGAKVPSLEWRSRSMHALVDISDKEAIYAILDKDDK
jgi:hypothetical protein